MEMLLRLWEVLTGALDACANARNMTVSTPHSKTSASREGRNERSDNKGNG